MRGHLAGSRIRDRRLALGLRQGNLAKAVGISPAYLNLIEHNRRRIGGRVLNALAQELDINPALLAEGVQVELVEALTQIAKTYSDAGAEADRARELAERFPGWAQMLIDFQNLVERQNQVLAGLSDRLAHDPQLAASLHEVLSVVTAIHATASILSGDDTIEPDWQARFHRNLFEDSARLAGSARALVTYLDDAARSSDSDTAPRDAALSDDFDTWLAGQGHRLPEIEAAPSDRRALLGAIQAAESAGVAPQAATKFVQGYAREAARLPAPTLVQAFHEIADPLAISTALGVPLDMVLRRLSQISETDLGFASGLVVADSSGAFVFRKPLEGFPVPRHGVGCPLWPIYQAQMRPGQPQFFHLEQAGYVPRRFLAFAIAVPRLSPSYANVQVYESTMLVVPQEAIDEERLAQTSKLEVGPGCRICPRTECPARHGAALVA